MEPSALPSLQGFAALLAGAIVAALGALQYIRTRKASAGDDEEEVSRIRLVGAAIADSAALATIADEIAQIRVFLQTQAALAHQREVFLRDRPDPLVEVLKVLAGELRRLRLARPGRSQSRQHQG